jgi:hypothetical protein
MFYNRVQRVLGSNLDRDADRSDWRSSYFSPFLPYPLQVIIYQSSYHSNLYNLDADIVVKPTMRRNTNEFTKFCVRLVLMWFYLSFRICGIIYFDETLSAVLDPLNVKCSMSFVSRQHINGVFNPLKTEFLLNNISIFSLYLTGNTLFHSYKDKPVIAV